MHSMLVLLSPNKRHSQCHLSRNLCKIRPLLYGLRALSRPRKQVTLLQCCSSFHSPCSVKGGLTRDSNLDRVHPLHVLSPAFLDMLAQRNVI